MAGTKRKADEAPAAAPSKRARPAAPKKAAAAAKTAATGKSRKPTKTAATPPKKAAAPKTAKAASSPKKAAAPKEKAGKRKSDEETPAAAASKKLNKGPVINEAPQERVNVYVMGEGSSGELGLGTAKKGIDVKRPRLNPSLTTDKVGVVKVSAGGMHALALTHDSKILSWGVNDQGALGRDTEWEGGLRDMDSPEDSDSENEDDDNGLNPKESNPAEVDFSQTEELADGTRFTDIAAGDSCSFAVTDDGRVYGWGTFRKADGIFGFTTPGDVARRPVLIQTLTKITSIAAGANHALALDSNGAVWAWGNGEQSQLGRRVIARTPTEGLVPRQFGLPKGPKNGIASIACGNDHSFAISKNGTVYSWGCNNFGETGHKEGAGADNSVIINPRPIAALKGTEILSISGGVHHSIAATATGECLVWGRADAAAMGIDADDMLKLPEDAIIRDDRDRVRIIILPQAVTAIDGKVRSVGAAGDQSMAVTEEGKAWSWGFSTNYQTGQGVIDDVEVATMIDNTAVRNKKVMSAELGGQYSILTAQPEDLLPNGV